MSQILSQFALVSLLHETKPALIYISVNEHDLFKRSGVFDPLNDTGARVASCYRKKFK